MAVGIVDFLKVIDVSNDQAKGRAIGAGIAIASFSFFSNPRRLSILVKGSLSASSRYCAILLFN
jgi:hypothetical protein